MIDLQENTPQKSEYQLPIAVPLVISADLHQALSDGNVENARKIFFRLLTEAKRADLKNLIDNINAMLKQYRLALDPKKVFSLKAMLDELVNQLKSCSKDNARIALLENNQWLQVFVDNNEKTRLHSRMREYELALRAKATQKESENSVLMRGLAFSIIAALSLLFIDGMSLGPWLTPLISTQIACIGFAILNRGFHETADSRSSKYFRELESFEVSDTVHFATDSLERQELVEIKKLLDRFDDLLKCLNSGGCYGVFSATVKYTDLLQTLKSLDNDAYTKIYNTANDIEIASLYYNSAQIARRIGVFYIILSIALTSLVALSIGLTHTHNQGLHLGGIFLSIFILLPLIAGSVTLMINTNDRPSINENFKRDKINELTEIRKKLENNLSEKPLLPPPGESNACYAPQAGMHFQYIPFASTPPLHEQHKGSSCQVPTFK